MRLVLMAIPLAFLACAHARPVVSLATVECQQSCRKIYGQEMPGANFDPKTRACSCIPGRVHLTATLRPVSRVGGEAQNPK